MFAKVTKKMSERCKAVVICDSVSPKGVRLTSLEVTFPRIILAEVNTHRVFSRNSASSRAIPAKKMWRMCRDNPYFPAHWGENQPGMSAHSELTGVRLLLAKVGWFMAWSYALFAARICILAGLHKQMVNRILEPFMWHTVLITATEWENFLGLRLAPDAHPDIRDLARQIDAALSSSRPEYCGYGQIHLPYVTIGEQRMYGQHNCVRISVARCARLSYLTQSEPKDKAREEELYDRLLESRHMSPFEHVAWPNRTDEWSGNFYGWIQHRKAISGEQGADRIRG